MLIRFWVHKQIGQGMMQTKHHENHLHADVAIPQLGSLQVRQVRIHPVTLVSTVTGRFLHTIQVYGVKHAMAPVRLMPMVMNMQIRPKMKIVVTAILMEIFINFSAFYNEKVATILSLPLISVTLLLVWGQMFFMRGRSYVNFGVAKEGKSAFKLGWLKSPFVVAAALVVTVAVVVPLWVMVGGSGALKHYLEAFT